MIFNWPGGQIRDLKLKFPGYHNLENAIVAISVALSLGVSEENIRNGIESYAGVGRRFEYIIKNDKLVFIDDYAHHPVEITAFIRSVKSDISRQEADGYISAPSLQQDPRFCRGLC